VQEARACSKVQFWAKVVTVLVLFLRDASALSRAAVRCNFISTLGFHQGRGSFLPSDAHPATRLRVRRWKSNGFYKIQVF